MTAADIPAALPGSRLAGDVRAVARLLPHLAEHRRLFGWSVLAGLLAQAGTIGAALTGAWVAGLAVSGDRGPFPGWVVPVALGCVLVAGIATWWEMYVAHDLAYVVLAGLRVTVYQRLSRILPARDSARHSGDLSTTALGDVERLEWLLAHVLGQLLVTATVICGCTTLAALIDPRVLVVLAPADAAIATLPWWLRRVADRQAARERTATAALQAEIVDTVQGLAELSAADALPQRCRALARRTRELTRIGLRSSARAGVETAAAELIVVTGSVLILVLATARVQQAALPVAMLPVLLTLAGAVLLPLGQLANTLQQAGSLRASLTRIADVLDAPDSVPAAPARTAPGPAPRPAAGAGGGDDAPAIEMHHVQFGYDPARPVLRGVTLRVERGETVALAGPSGAGKSTIVALLQRFWDPDGGAIAILGDDLRELEDDRLRARIAVVAQEVHLFAGTLADNLRLGRPSASPQDLARAVHSAQLTDLVDRLPDGLATTVGERGASLSGGERARVAIARALVADSPILLLDEAVAGLDNRTEHDLHEALRRHRTAREAAGGTLSTLIVAHRPGTIARADRVVVLRDGRIVAAGTPAHTRAEWSRLPATD